MKVNSAIVFQSSSFLIKLISIVSVLLLIQGHNNPGGGFIGGLTFICAYILMKINIHEIYLVERVGFRKAVLVIGMLLLVVAVLYPVLVGEVPLTGLWLKFTVASQLLKLGSPLIFDIGVYLVVAMSISFVVDFLEQKWS